jgi:hypothetical protein
MSCILLNKHEMFLDIFLMAAPMLMSQLSVAAITGSRISGTDRNKVNVIPASLYLSQSAILSHILSLKFQLGSSIYNFYLIFSQHTMVLLE